MRDTGRMDSRHHLTIVIQLPAVRRSFFSEIGQDFQKLRFITLFNVPIAPQTGVSNTLAVGRDGDRSFLAAYFCLSPSRLSPSPPSTRIVKGLGSYSWAVGGLTFKSTRVGARARDHAEEHLSSRSQSCSFLVAGSRRFRPPVIFAAPQHATRLPNLQHCLLPGDTSR